MAFRNRMRPVINSVKHVVDSQVGMVLGVSTNVTLINTVDNPVLANAADIASQSIVKAVYLKVEAYATTAGALSNIYMQVQKSPGANIPITQGNLVGIDKDKKFTIHQEMVMLQKVINGNPRTLFAGVIRIPKRYQRFGYLDVLTLNLFAPGVNTDACVQCIYKEFK